MPRNVLQRLVLLFPVLAASLATAAWRPVDPPKPGKLVTVRMVDLSPTKYRFEPAAIRAASGDTIRFVQTGVMPHNVDFRTLPAGVKLGAATTGPYLLTKGQTCDLVIDDRFMTGDYAFVCAPHMALGMKGQITIISGP